MKGTKGKQFADFREALTHYANGGAVLIKDMVFWLEGNCTRKSTVGQDRVIDWAHLPSNSDWLYDEWIPPQARVKFAGVDAAIEACKTMTYAASEALVARAVVAEAVAQMREELAAEK